MNLPDDYTVVGPDGQCMNFDSLDEIMKNPMMADSILHMAGIAVEKKWQIFERTTTDLVFSLRAHGNISNVEDVVVVFIDELFKALTPFHQLYAKVFEHNPIDYSAVTNMRTEIAQMQNKFLPGLPLEGMLSAFVSVVPNTVGINIVDIGMAYQSLMFFHDKVQAAKTFPPETIEASREHFVRMSHEGWTNLLTSVSQTCKAELPTEVVPRAIREAREYRRLVREGLDRNKACDEAFKVIRQAGSKEAFYAWFDKEFNIDSEQAAE